MRQMRRHSRLQQLQGHLTAWRMAQQQPQLLMLLLMWHQT
jgi:hypothetical protein